MSFTVNIFKYKTDLGNLPTGAIVRTAVGSPYLCFILALKTAYCNRIAIHIRIFPNWQKPGKKRNGEKCHTSLQQPKRTEQTIIFDPTPGPGLKGWRGGES